jgi:hypothetical protein
MATVELVDTRPRRRLWLVPVGYLGVLAVLIVLMQSVRLLDPTGYEGRSTGAAMTAAWCAGLGVFLLGVVRRHNSRFTMRTLAILTAVVAVYLGLCRALNPVIPTLIAAAGFSLAMLREVQIADGKPRPFRGPLSRAVMAAGGLFFLAHALRVLGYVVLISTGVVKVP